MARSASALPQIAAQFGIEPPAVTGSAEAAPANASASAREASRPDTTGGRCRVAGRRGSVPGSADRVGRGSRARTGERSDTRRRGRPRQNWRRRLSKPRSPTNPHRSPTKRSRVKLPPWSSRSLLQQRRRGSCRSAWLACAAMAMVEYETRGRVGIFTLNRPEARNAVNGEVADGMEAAIDRSRTTPRSGSA